MLPLDGTALFDPARDEECFAALPSRAAVFLIEPREELAGARPILLRTADLQRRLRILLGPPDPSSKRLHLREYARRVRFRVTGSPFEQALTQWQHARALWPQSYRQRLRLRPAALVKVNLANPYPRAYGTRRFGPDGMYFGPFATRRAADAFLEAFQDLFRVRRCQIKIRRDPAFPGCIYSEMKMCLAPCFAGCTADEYASEVARVVCFLETRGASLSEELSRDRETASAQLDFERASTLHRRLEKAAAVWRLTPEIARCVSQLDAVIVQRASQNNTIALFVVREGRVADPFLLHFAELASQPRSVEEMLRALLEPPAGSPAGSEARHERAGEREDHLALLSRWFHAKPRQGEIFFADHKPFGWPYRRMLRACSRVLAAPGA